ncbi:type I-B CRISPR-associated protein Cas7/Cst2/DevR [Anaerocellum danielii]|uniref:Type I-B CRISPR-associated protein Cas7/Cst2/DevR n=1 Tax=Anaerocellum danielii TaxID=1387557 RepID=A0ABZ0U3W1_9FIRM|nr:type I-B CRISPR-associated protein Cas7/Cst2/DevR [Caldicellulosiruptor danielii]WPX08955.1 type I-B CRISPR-associated protein Cas7/Cst2/DevR [Caldicellulosiruptor danielii]
MLKKGFTASIIFLGNSLNYGEGFSNFSELKKFARGDGNLYTFGSRQCLRYDITRLGNERFGWELVETKREGQKGTIQFKIEENDIAEAIKKYEELDLFGYMITKRAQRGKKKKGNDGEETKDEEKGESLTRSAVVRLSHAISLEPYKNDLEFLSNKGMADRLEDREENRNSNIANIEFHTSFYSYTITIDLSRVGVIEDGKNVKEIIGNEEKFKRVSELLDIIKLLNRNIRGRCENLSPIFIIGGVYDIVHPFFLGRLQIKGLNQKYYILKEPLESTLNLQIWRGKKVKDDTYVGAVAGIFENLNEIGSLVNSGVISVDEFFEKAKEKIKEYYEVK